MRGRRAEARRGSQRMKRIFPSSFLLRSRSGPGRGSLGVAGAFAVALALHPEPAWAHGDLHEVIENVSRQIAAAPGEAELYLRRGELFRAHQDWAAAAADYDRAAALVPELAAVDLARGEMLAQAGSPAEAKEVLDRFLLRKLASSAGFATRGRTLAALGEWHAAAEDFARAIETASEPDPGLFLEQAHAWRSAGQPGGAVRALGAGIVRLGPLVTLMQPAIDLEVEAGSFDAALRRVETMLALAPRKERWLFQRGEIMERAGRRSEAAEAFRAAMAACERVPIERRTVAAAVEFEHKLRAAVERMKEPGA